MERDKWAQAGWRIEQKYGSKVLIGNWAEERFQFTREPKIANSTSLADYRPHWDFKPDVSERRSALLRAEGLPYKMLFTHQSPPSSDYSVTHYQESYVHKRNNVLPILQPWHLDNFTKKHVKSDQPVSALSTKSGVLESTNHRFEKLQSHLPSLTVYGSTYQRHPLGAFCQNRFARASHMLSSHFYAANRNNKDLHLRDHLLLQVPDNCISQDYREKFCY